MQIGIERADAFLGYYIDDTADSLAVIQCRGCPTHHFDTLDVIDVKPVVVNITITTFSTDALTVLEEKHRLGIHALISNLRHLTHGIVIKLNTW